MTKQAFTFVVFASVCLLCFTASTESRAVATEGKPIGSEQFVPNSPNDTLAPSGAIISDQQRDISASDQIGTSWCIVKPSTDAQRLQANIDFSCGKRESGPPIDCTIIQYGGACYYPGNKVSDASVVMNLYYKATGKNYWNCDFGGSGLIIYNDPSIGQCRYEA